SCSGVSRHHPGHPSDPPSGSSLRTSTFPSSIRYSFAGEPSPDSRRSRTLPNDISVVLAGDVCYTRVWAKNRVCGQLPTTQTIQPSELITLNTPTAARKFSSRLKRAETNQ